MYDATFSLPGHTMIEHSLWVPLDRFGALSRFAGDETAAIPEKIELFAREYVRHGNEKLPRLVYFQGGPGFGGPRMAPIGSWLDTALNHYRVVLLDERGTGRSHPIEAQAVSAVGPTSVQAAFISCFRQDSIAADANYIIPGVFDPRVVDKVADAVVRYVTGKEPRHKKKSKRDKAGNAK